MRAVQEMRDVLLSAGKIVVEPDDFVPTRDQRVCEMGTEESGRAGDEDAGRVNSWAAVTFIRQRLPRPSPRRRGAQRDVAQATLGDILEL